jgi:glycosyltransferase involved in cell wall biosynthesis
MKKLPITIIMLTINEEYYLPGAIENVKPWAEDIFILDSLSNDRTIDIALEQGINIVQRPFTNFGDQWNFALKCLPIKSPWIMKLDPDERVTAKLVEEMGCVTQLERPCNGYYIPRRLWFMGKPLHVCFDVLRLWKTGEGRFSDVLVNEHPIINGTVGRLKGIIDHYDSPNLHHWLEKQNRYSTMEAIMVVKDDAFPVEPKFFGNTLQRRMFFKKVFSKIPFRFLLLYLYYLLYCGLWRDGRLGSSWAHLRSEVMRNRELKAREMELTGEIAKIPKAAHGHFDPRIISTSLQKRILSDSR